MFEIHGEAASDQARSMQTSLELADTIVTSGPSARH